jgi:tetraacyldisaccharide 4'-kinase
MKDTLEDIETFVTEVILHNKRGLRAMLCRGLFYGLSKVFAALVSFRLWLYQRRYIHDHHLGVPVISIGNLTVGGTGKTPVVELFARTLRDKGRSVAILSRGYKSKRQKKTPLWKKAAAMFHLIEKPKRPLPRVVSDTKQVLLQDAYVAGDEPLMLARNLPGVPVVVDRDRVNAGRYAIENFHADALVLDDGMQYLRLKHRLDIVLVDRTAGFSGAELEQTVIEAMHLAFAEGREPGEADLIAAASQVVPLSRTAREQLEALRQWASSGRARPASLPGSGGPGRDVTET